MDHNVIKAGERIQGRREIADSMIAAGVWLKPVRHFIANVYTMFIVLTNKNFKKGQRHERCKGLLRQCV